jgi:HAD superfamily hydrolase (TIGR01484 family)
MVTVTSTLAKMVKSPVISPSIRLLALDIDGTLLNSQFQISDANLSALRRAHAAGIEIVLVTGRRHDFAMPMQSNLVSTSG